MAELSYNKSRNLGSAKANEFSLVDNFKYTYRNREDVTNLPPGVLIVGSQNVLSNVSERIQIRKGYALDGATSSTASAILSSFDWLTRYNGEKHMRAGFLTSAANDGKLQYRYVDSAGTVTWRDLLISLTSVSYNFCTWWNATEILRECLFVNGASQIQAWNGAVTTFASATANTVTKQGTDTWAQTGFYALGNISAATIAFVNNGANPDTITDSGNGFIAGGFYTGQKITVTGSASNNGTYTIKTVVAGTITLIATDALTNEGAGAAVVIRSVREIVIGGVTATYTGGESTTTLTGVSVDFSASAVASPIHQGVRTSPNTAMSGIPTTFANGLIANLNNQIYVGSLTSSTYYLSKVDSYTDFTFSTPRQSGEGWNRTLDANLVAFEPQENFMYVSAGQDLWYNINFSLQTSTVGITYEQVNALPLKTGRRQGAKSQAYVSHMKNNIIMVSNEPTIDMFGRVEDSLATPQTKNISDSIKIDVDRYDFTDGSIFYHRFNIYVAVPKEELVLIFNLSTNSWEAPQTIPISRFYIVDGELYGHSYLTSESYQLFTGYADRVYPTFLGNPIDAKMIFSYQNYGTRCTTYKKANALYVEGYINANTIINTTITYELDGCKTVKTFEIDGSDRQIVCILDSDASLGKKSLGKQKLGGASALSINDLPPKFRVEKTFNNTNFFEASMSFEVLGINTRFEILAFGLNASQASEEPIIIRQ